MGVIAPLEIEIVELFKKLRLPESISVIWSKTIEVLLAAFTTTLPCIFFRGPKSRLWSVHLSRDEFPHCSLIV
jgi:hypothetical protein